MARTEFDDGRDVGTALRRLPLPAAPRTLLPRVMAAVAAAQPRTWFTWPLAWQAASVAALFLLAAGAAAAWPGVQTLVDGVVVNPFAGTTGRATSAIRGITAIAEALSIAWSALLQPVVPYLLLWLIVMSAACVGFGAALGRIAELSTSPTHNGSH
jgi:hypothetical protein